MQTGFCTAVIRLESHAAKMLQWFQNRNRYSFAMAAAQPETLTQQLQQGEHWIAQTLSYWLRRSTLTTRQMEAIASWGMGRSGQFTHSVINRIINGKCGASLMSLVAMSSANYAIWSWHTEGHDVAIQELGPFSKWNVQAKALENAIWLSDPKDDKLYLTLHDFVDVAVGRLKLTYLGNRLLLPGDYRLTNERLRQLLDNAIVAAGLTPMAGVRQLLAAYPASDPARLERFRGVILGELQLTRDELQDELTAIGEAVRVMRQLPLGQYGAAQLLAELLAMPLE